MNFELGAYSFGTPRTADRAYGVKSSDVVAFELVQNLGDHCPVVAEMNW